METLRHAGGGPWLLLSGCVEAVEALARSLHAEMVKPTVCQASAYQWVDHPFC